MKLRRVNTTLSITLRVPVPRPSFSPVFACARQVPMPRAALKDLANSRGLARAAAEANATVESGGGGGDADSAGKPDASFDEAGGVELWADWPFSCVRLRGDPATVRRAVRCARSVLRNGGRCAGQCVQFVCC